MSGEHEGIGARLVGASVGLERAVVRVLERCWSVGALGHQWRPVPTWVLLAVSLTLASAAASAGQTSILEHPAIGEVVSMIEADVSQEVIVARILQMEAVPTLTGEEIVALKQRGATDLVLLALVRAGAPDAPPFGDPAAESTTDLTATPGRTVTSDRTVASSAIRVLIASSFPVTHYEVSVDDISVATRGELFEGESEPGRVLKRPKSFSLEEPAVAFEGDVAPGEHAVLVGFAVSRVNEDPTVNWMEYSRQRYATSGVRAAEGPGPGRGWSANTAVPCSVASGQTCVVTVRFEKKSPSRFGGLPVYSVTYQVDIATDAGKDGQD